LLEHLFLGCVGLLSLLEAISIQVDLVGLRDVVGGHVFILYLPKVGLDALGVIAERSQEVVSNWVHLFNN